MRENSFGRALPITEITPTAPVAIMWKVMASSPDKTSKSAGLFFIISSTCSMEPDASFIATILSQSLASRHVVSGLRLMPVRPGTL